MKWIALIILMLLIAVAIIWYAIGGLVLGIIVGAFFAAAFGIACFALGSWWSKRLMESGAQIALTAQVSDDRRDERQANIFGKLMHSGFKAGQDYAKVERPGYPALPFHANGDAQQPIDVSFPISGFEDEQ